MQKARSRLSSNEPPADLPTRSPLRSTAARNTHLSSYLRYLPTLILSFPLYGCAYYIVTTFSPQQIRHIILPNTYLPLLLVIFLANGFLFSFFLLKTRRGFLFSALITLLLFLKLQSVIVTWQVVTVLLISFAIIELILTQLERKKAHANISKRSN
jgi:hypothetical protein